MLFFMDNVEIFKDLFAKIEAVRAEKLTAGTRFRLMGLVADIAEFTRSLQTQVLDVVCHEAVVDADADIDYAALAEQVMGHELTECAAADEQVREQTRLVNEALGLLSDVLVRIEEELERHHKDEEYARLYEAEKRRYMNSGTAYRSRKTFEEWRDDECNGLPQREDIEDYRMEKLVKMFEKGVLASRVEHIQRAKRYADEVDFDQLDDDHPLKKSAHKHYAALRKLVDYKDGCLVVDPVRVGRHFYVCRHEENAKANRTRFLEYMHKVSLAQEELLKLQQTQEEALNQADGTEQLNLFAPKKNLQELLKKSWFAEVRADEKYDVTWTDSFLEALMASEHGDGIACDWAVQGKRNKRTQIMGYIVGLLADAGVLKGSYDSIAKKMGMTEDPRSFSRYMGQGKHQPYSDWVREWING